MKRTERNAATATIESAPKRNEKSNGHSNITAEPTAADFTTILAGLQTMRDGDFSVRLPGSWTGLAGKVADTFNEIVAANQQMADELKRVGQVVGKEGRTRERTRFHESRGAWGENGDFGQHVGRGFAAANHGSYPCHRCCCSGQLDPDRPAGRGWATAVEGEFLRSANIVNTMIQQLGVFTAEVTRVAREVGTDGKLGGQAQVPGVAGTWKDLTDSVNSMAVAN